MLLLISSQIYRPLEPKPTDRSGTFKKDLINNWLSDKQDYNQSWLTLSGLTSSEIQSNFANRARGNEWVTVHLIFQNAHLKNLSSFLSWHYSVLWIVFEVVQDLIQEAPSPSTATITKIYKG